MSSPYHRQRMSQIAAARPQVDFQKILSDFTAAREAQQTMLLRDEEEKRQKAEESRTAEKHPLEVQGEKQRQSVLAEQEKRASAQEERSKREEEYAQRRKELEDLGKGFAKDLEGRAESGTLEMGDIQSAIDKFVSSADTSVMTPEERARYDALVEGMERIRASKGEVAGAIRAQVDPNVVARMGMQDRRDIEKQKAEERTNKRSEDQFARAYSEVQKASKVLTGALSRKADRATKVRISNGANAAHVLPFVEGLIAESNTGVYSGRLASSSEVRGRLEAAGAVYQTDENGNVTGISNLEAVRDRLRSEFQATAASSAPEIAEAMRSYERATSIAISYARQLPEEVAEERIRALVQSQAEPRAPASDTRAPAGRGRTGGLTADERARSEKFAESVREKAYSIPTNPAPDAELVVDKKELARLIREHDRKYYRGVSKDGVFWYDEDGKLQATSRQLRERASKQGAK